MACMKLRNELAQAKRDAEVIVFETSGLRGKQAIYPKMFASLSNFGNSLDDSFSDQVRKTINLTRNIWGLYGDDSHNPKNCAEFAKQPIPVAQTNNGAEQLGDISDWTLKVIRRRVAAAGEIA